MSKHTHGRWEAVARLNNWKVTTTPPPRLVICTINNALVGQHDIAHLIAAAPEMAEEIKRLRREKAQLLAALEGLLAGAERHIFHTECQAERDAARAAIVKAKGGVR